MALNETLAQMPKIELHVHLEGSTRPETLLKLAKLHDVDLPADTVEGLREWYKFSDFPHFATIYWKCAECLKGPDDIELITREFLEGQAAQNVLHTEATYTPLTQFRQRNIPFRDQLAAIQRGIAWGRATIGVSMSLTIDIPRDACADDESLLVADWAIEGFGNGVTAFGLGGAEIGFPAERFKAAFDRARAAGLPSAPHAGETDGPRSIWGAIDDLGGVRVGHGVRCLEDPGLVQTLRERGTVLEVCPTSNVCLGVVPNFESHMVPKLIAEGLNVTINSDDPPMFETTLTQELQKCAAAFDWDLATFRDLQLTAAKAAFVDDVRRRELISAVESWYAAAQPAVTSR